MIPTVMVSGGFDPIHPGHIALLREASLFGKVIVALNSDEWLTRKKGKPFMPFASREVVVSAIRWVHMVVPVNDLDNTVKHAISIYHPTFFANGGDRGETNTPEVDLCNQLGVKLLWNIGGDKSSSSSDLLKEWSL